MYYLFVLVVGVFWLKLTDHIKVSNFFTQLLLWFPLLYFYGIPLWLQRNIGTDYYTYYNYFYNSDYEIYSYKGEFAFYYIVEFVRYLGEPQFLFIILGTIQMSLFFYTLYLLKNRGYKTWLIFFLFIVVTTIYNNQMNGLRQFVVVNSMLLFVILITEKQFIKYIVLSILALLFHKTSIIVISLIFILKKYFPYSRGRVAFIFIASAFLYSINYMDYMQSFVTNYIIFLSHYLHYLNTKSELINVFDIQSILGKVYFVPILLVFYFTVFKNKKELSTFEVMCSIIVAITYFLFLQANYFGLFLRLWQYFNIFMIVPIYLVINWTIEKKQQVLTLCTLLYLSLPYLYKVLVVAEREYSFNLIIF